MESRSLHNLGVVARVCGDLDGAWDALTRAQSIAESRGDEHQVALALLNRSGVLLDRGDLDGSEQLIFQAVHRAQTIGDDATLLEALENLAAVWGQQQRLLAAAWMFGAAEAMARALSTTRSTIEQPLYDRYVEGAKGAAEGAGIAAQFAAAWRSGATAQADVAVEVALGTRPVPGEELVLPAAAAKDRRSVG